MSFFVTAIAYYPNSDEKKYKEPFRTTRTFGHFADLERAKKAVETNEGDMHECLYNYLVIEEIPYGIHGLTVEDKDETKHEWWYTYLEGTQWWVSIEKPKWSRTYTNWGIG